jgi:HEAT repeat protein
MSKVDEYREALASESDWDTFLAAHSGLPGPRGNIELGKAAADLASADQIRAWLEWDAERAPTNSPQEFLAFCGVLGLGRLALEGDATALPQLLQSASDPRWRTREAVAMALQRIGDVDFNRLLTETDKWARGSCLEQRAAAAALCEPRLLSTPQRVTAAVSVLDTITASITQQRDRRSEDFKVLRKGMGYCWSVAVAAHPDIGKPAMERWIGHGDPDVRWVMRENLRKKRLERMDPAWVERQKATLGE